MSDGSGGPEGPTLEIVVGDMGVYMTRRFESPLLYLSLVGEFESPTLYYMIFVLVSPLYAGRFESPIVHMCNLWFLWSHELWPYQLGEDGPI